MAGRLSSVPGLPADFGLADLPELLPQAQAAKGWIRLRLSPLWRCSAKTDLLMWCKVPAMRGRKVSVEVSRMQDAGTAEDRLLQECEAVQMQGLRLDG
jgi:hypothetical protein